MQAAISADIVRSTSLNKEDLFRLQKHLNEFVSSVDKLSNGSWGRVVRGDGVEIVVKEEKYALRVALLLRYWVKSMEINNASKRFLKDGIRVAIGLGGLKIDDVREGIIDGVAIYASGRALPDMKRDSFVIVCGKGYNRECLVAISMLLDALVSGSTRAQCVAMYNRISGKTIVEICEEMKRTEQAVYCLLRNAGCRAVEQALKMFEEGKILYE